MFCIESSCIGALPTPDADGPIDDGVDVERLGIDDTLLALSCEVLPFDIACNALPDSIADPGRLLS